VHQRSFTFADQIAFAELSGDNNPLHVDPVVARRSLFGQPVVHGVHALMWALDQWLAGGDEPMQLQHLHVVFLKPIGLDQEVRYKLVSEQQNRVRIDLLKDGEMAVRMMFEWLPGRSLPQADVSPASPPQQPPEILNRETIRAGGGLLDLHLPRKIVGRLFPNLARRFCPVQSAILLGLTRLVGVKCPGLHSIFSELKLAAGDTGDQKNIRYSVAEFEDRYGLALLAVAAPGLSGTLKAFLRPPPQEQPAFLNLKHLVATDEFAGQRALVVGGSRGLGEVAAKLLAAGGAEVQLTYHAGQADAQKVVAEIVSGGGRASGGPLNILKPEMEWLDRTPPTHLYYFASPHISGSGKTFSADRFKNFCDYYVTGFAGLVEFLQKLGLRKVFYPSTVFLDELPPQFIEYALAKGAGEILCQALGKKYPEIVFHCPRLPKLATDQTVSLQPAQTPDPVPIILAALQNIKG
jgi:hypothetical protein